MKFVDGLFSITKDYMQELEHKKTLFRERTNTNHTLFTTLLTAHGVKKNTYFVSVFKPKLAPYITL